MAAGLGLTSCSRQAAEQQPASASASAVATIFDAMNATVIPKSTLIWELAGNLYGDDGKLDAKRLTDAQWVELKDAAIAMGASAKSLADATGIKVAAPGMKIMSEGTEGSPGATEVQALIDADPQSFSALALPLVAISAEIAAAAAARDAAKVDDAQGRLTDVCGACHAKFWNPKLPGP
jgi:hypothetical protein